MDTDVAIIGAGISGLALCDELGERGVDCLVLEKADAPGGVIASVRKEGRVMELGPQRLRLTPAVRAAIGGLGLEDRVQPAADGLPLYVYHRGRLRRAPLSIPEFWRTDLLSWPGKLRMLLEPLRGPPRREETVAEALRRKFGEEAYRRFLGPLFGGIYASHPREMPARFSLLPAWRAMGLSRSALAAVIGRRLSGRRPPGACTFPGGLAELPLAYGRRDADRIRLSTPVEGVERDGEGLRLRLPDAVVRCRRAVLSVPAGEAGRLLGTVAPGAASRLAGLRYNPVTLVHLLSDGGLRGYGHQVSLDETELYTRGSTWNESLFGRQGVYTSYVGDVEDAGEADLDRVARIAAREFTRVTGSRARPIHVHRTAMPAYDRSWSALEELGIAGDDTELAPRVYVCASWQSRPGIPGRMLAARRLADRMAGPPA